MNGGSLKHARAWMDYPMDEDVQLEARIDGPASESIKVRVSCSTPPPKPSATPTATSNGLYFVNTDGMPAKFVQINNEMTFCPNRDLGSSMFTIACVVPTISRRSRLTVLANEEVVARTKKSRKSVLYIAGEDSDGVPKPWEEYPSSQMEVRCWSRTPKDEFGKRQRFRYRASFKFSCNNTDSSPPTASPSVSPTASAEAMAPSPSVLPTMSESPSPTPTTEGVNDGLTSAQRQAGCIVLYAEDAAKLSTGWVQVKNRRGILEGVEFEPRNSEESVKKAGLFPFELPFKAPKTSRYAVVLDTTTRAGSEHNDVWMNIPDVGFRLQKNGSKPISRANWTKGYQNSKSRKALISSVDFNPHSISTGGVLSKDENYVFEISGRSSRVIVHRVIMFPCAENECFRGRKWKKSLEFCAPGSTKNPMEVPERPGRA